MATKFHDIFTNPARYKQHGTRIYTVTVDGRLFGIVLATKYSNYEQFALNKRELERLLASKRDGRIAEAVVVSAKIEGWNYPNTYCSEVDAERLEDELTGVEPKNGRFGPFYVLDGYDFEDSPI